MNEIEYVAIEVTVERVTDKALLVITGDGGEHWVPKSFLHPEDNEVSERYQHGDLVIPAWLATKEGME